MLLKATGNRGANHIDKLGRTPLNYLFTFSLHHEMDENPVANQNRIALTKALLEGWDDTEQTLDECGQSKLHYASVLLELSDVEDITGILVDVDFRNRDGQTALHVAISSGKDATALELLMNGANPAVTNNGGDSSLMIVCRNGGCLNSVQWMADNGSEALLTATNGEEQTCLGLMCANGHAKTVEILLGTKLLYPSQPLLCAGNSILHLAFRGNQKEIIDMIFNCDRLSEIWDLTYY